MSENLIGLPSLSAPGEVAPEIGLGEPSAELALRGVSVTEAGSAAKLVLTVDVEMTGHTTIAALSLHVLLADALATVRVAGGLVAHAALRPALAVLAAVEVEVPVVGLALVALGPGDALLALALSVHGALHVGRSGGVAVAGQALAAAALVLVGRLVVVGAAPLAVGPVAVAAAVQALSAATGRRVQLLVETAIGGPVVAFTSYQK